MIITSSQVVVFLLVLARIAGLFIQAPIISSRSIPAFAKTALAIWIAIIFWFVVPVNVDLLPQTFISFLIYLTIEVAIGFCLGFVANAVFLAIQDAGELMDTQMGLSVAQIFDPSIGTTVSIMGRLMFIIGVPVFLMFDGHHLLLTILFNTFKLLPAPSLVNFGATGVATLLIGMINLLLTIAVRFAAPILVIIFISDFCFGILSKVAPQVNVFSLGFQVKPTLGLLIFVIMIAIMISNIGGLLELIAQKSLEFIGAIKI